MKFLLRLLIQTVILSVLNITAACAAARPVVVELYTSQGCSSCPAADALLETMVSDPTILALSFHVHYWDNLGWKDPFSSELNTARQRAYSQTLGLDSVFTPQMIIDGQISAVGSDKGDITNALARARKDTINVPVTITPDATRANLIIAIAASAQVPPTATAWEIHFNRHAVTAVGAGENSGSTIENVNNVTRFMRLDLKAGRVNEYVLPMNEWPEDAVAIVLQDKPVGRVIGAAVYIKPGRG